MHVAQAVARRGPASPATSTYWPPTIPPTPIASESSRSAASTRCRLALPGARGSACRPPRTARRRRGSRRSRRRRCGTSGGRGAGRRRPSRAGRRGSASRCGPARSRPRSAAPSAGSRAERARRGERQHRPDPLAAGEQRVAHRLVEARGRRLVARSASRPRKSLDERAQVVRVGGARRRRCRGRAGPSAQSSSSWPGAGLVAEPRARAGRARRRPARRARRTRPRAASPRRARGRPSRRRPARLLQPPRDLREPRRALVSHGHAVADTLRSSRASRRPGCRSRSRAPPRRSRAWRSRRPRRSRPRPARRAGAGSRTARRAGSRARAARSGRRAQPIALLARSARRARRACSSTPSTSSRVKSVSGAGRRSGSCSSPGAPRAPRSIRSSSGAPVTRAGSRRRRRPGAGRCGASTVPLRPARRTRACACRPARGRPR